MDVDEFEALPGAANFENVVVLDGNGDAVIETRNVGEDAIILFPCGVIFPIKSGICNEIRGRRS